MKKIITVSLCFLACPAIAFGDEASAAKQANYDRTHYVEILDKSAAEAERQHPGNTHFAEMLRHEVIHKIDTDIYAWQLMQGDIAGETETRTDMRLNDLEGQIEDQKHQIDELKRELDLKANQ